jgi:hypothetical protein
VKVYKHSHIIYSCDKIWFQKKNIITIYICFLSEILINDFNLCFSWQV